MMIKGKHHKDTRVKKDWTTFSNIDNHCAFNSEHNWEDLCIQSRYHETCTFNKHNKIRGCPIFNLVFVDVATQGLFF